MSESSPEFAQMSCVTVGKPQARCCRAQLKCGRSSAGCWELRVTPSRRHASVVANCSAVSDEEIAEKTKETLDRFIAWACANGTSCIECVFVAGRISLLFSEHTLPAAHLFHLAASSMPSLCIVTWRCGIVGPVAAFCKHPVQTSNCAALFQAVPHLTAPAADPTA